MTEKELEEALEKALEPIHEAHQVYLGKTMDVVKNAFEIGIEVGKQLRD